MSSGRRIHRLQLLTPVLSDDGEGGQSISDWTPGPRIWAEVLPVSAREQALAGALQTIATHVAEMSFDDRVTVKKRLARIYPTGPELEILGVRDPEGKQRRMEVECQEVV